MRSLFCWVLPVSFLFASFTFARTLFPFEKIQLTQEYLDTLPEEEAVLYAFGDQDEGDTDSGDVAVAAATRCRYGPDDGKWPSEKAWQKLAKQLNATDVLIKTVPQSAACYAGTAKNDAKCQDLTKNWNSSYTHIDDPVEVLSPVFQGLTCIPPSIYNSGNCTQGGYPAYVIKAHTVLDLQLGINFARNNGLRLVIKNTGHDFAGKSAGAGALSLWTHGMNDLQYFTEYVDGAYKGPAIKAGAGVQVSDLYRFANGKGVVAVAGGGQVCRYHLMGQSVLTVTDIRCHWRLYSRRWPFAA
jgi:hypothetical protein